MYAIFQSGGKQYQAKAGEIVKLEKLPGAVGDQVVLDHVLLVAEGEEVQVGQPILPNRAVQGRIVAQGRGPKVIVFKHKRRKDYRKKQGHRQSYTAVFIEGITGQQETSTEAVS